MPFFECNRIPAWEVEALLYFSFCFLSSLSLSLLFLSYSRCLSFSARRFILAARATASSADRSAAALSSSKSLSEWKNSTAVRDLMTTTQTLFTSK